MKNGSLAPLLRMAFCFSLVIPWWLAGAAAAEAGADEPETANCRILIITGEDYPGHRWRETTAALHRELSRESRMRVDVLADLGALAETRLEAYQSVVLHFKNYDPEVPGKAGLDNLKRFVKDGGGLVLLHFACGAFQEFKDDFEPLAGRVWFGLEPPQWRHQHDPYGRFTVEFADNDHPITADLEDFETVDELYTCLEGDVPVKTLATATSKVDQKKYPIAFVLTCGEGRVFHCVLGHDAEALSRPGPSQLIRRGCAWTARLESTAE